MDSALPHHTSFFSWAAQTWSGKRKERNDDFWMAFAASDRGVTKLPQLGNSTLEKEDLFFGVSDGMGGGQAGNVASRILLEEITRHIPGVFQMAAQGFRPDYIEELSQIVQSAHIGVHECGQAVKEFNGMSATCTLCWFTPENLYLVHVGDSRCYVLREGDGLIQLSQDHTFAWRQWKRGQISEFEYRKHPRRSALYEVMGGDGGIISPMISAFPWHPGDRFFLCSDGLVDGLWERQICEYLSNKSIEPKLLLNEMITHAKENDPKDDKTLLLIDIK